MISYQPYTKDRQLFLEDMVMEAVYWRKILQGVARDQIERQGLQKILKDFGERPGDEGLIAMIKEQPIGAVFVRKWTAEDEMRGFIRSDIPVLVIAVHPDHRGKGVGMKLLQSFHDRVKAQQLAMISLCVSKDNPALALYQGNGYELVEDIGDSYIMLKKLL